MTKDAFYFPHDSNAKDDPKITLLIDQLGLEGYGIFWVLIEILRDQPAYKYPIKLLPSIARKYATTYEKVNVVVRNYDLFEIENNEFFYSNSLNIRMIPLEKNREQRRLAGLKSAEKRKLKSIENQQQFNGRSTAVQQSRVEESRLDKSKEEKIKEKHSENEISKLELENQTLKKIIQDFNSETPKTEIEKKEAFLKLKERFKNYNAWMESVSMLNSITLSKTKSSLNTFLNDLFTKEDFYKSDLEIKKHFVNWIKLQLKKSI